VAPRRRPPWQSSRPMGDPFPLHGSTAMVTGANGGLGRAIARALHERGAQLILTGRRAEALEPLAAETGGRAVVADLTDRASLDSLAEEAAAVDVLVLNAALPGTGRLPTWEPDEIDRALDVNLRAPILLAREAAAAMTARGRGRIVFMSSLSAKSPQPSSSLYCATKFGVRGFALSLRAELHGTGVGVTVINPSFIRDAGMFHDSGVTLPRFLGTKRPEDVTRAVLKAIESAPAEIDVAPRSQSLGAAVGGLVPGFAEAFARRFGGGKITDQFAERQASKR
jgi:NADP-dependent 3-hydroxy acid dehydrogenase YdfG